MDTKNTQTMSATENEANVSDERCTPSPAAEPDPYTPEGWKMLHPDAKPGESLDVYDPYMILDPTPEDLARIERIFKKE